ncbi:unnamed protein product [Hymenolepis diminuta]|uniref:Uncharacterized protein n=1 Tax=Hymenolepis diminuta TaxID=6216 RepID=A0A564Y4V5_HYMDI|nr:unnamed protein product [Hymenolepis diminuta]
MRLAMLILVVTSPMACIRSSLTALTDSFLVSVQIAVLALMFIERTIFIEVKIATKSELQFIILRTRVLSLRLWLRVISK